MHLFKAWWYRLFKDPDPVQRAYEQNGDTFGWPQNFTGEEAAQLQATAQSPAVVAGGDIDLARLVGECQTAYADYRRGGDVFADARREPSPEVQR